VRVYYALECSYDTRSSRCQTHSQLLFELATALMASLDDLAVSKLVERVPALMFSVSTARNRG
jgi:hypothetical protein